MGAFIIWLLILVVIVANHWNTALWIFLIASALLLIAALSGNNQPKKAGGGKTSRIEKLHYMDLDEYQCPNCKARFRKNVMTCPKCGMQFTGTTVDDEEFIEEMEIWEEDDDE